jgi:hypothetical protein
MILFGPLPNGLILIYIQVPSLFLGLISGSFQMPKIPSLQPQSLSIVSDVSTIAYLIGINRSIQRLYRLPVFHL